MTQQHIIEKSLPQAQDDRNTAIGYHRRFFISQRLEKDIYELIETSMFLFSEVLF